MSLQRLIGQELGKRLITYTAQDAALYALAVGAQPDQLDLVYERDLRPLPTYVAALGMWATAAAAKAGGYREVDVLHVAQRIELFERLPATATIDMTASVPSVHDKGSSAIVKVVVESTAFRSTYSMFVKGGGGWGGERGPSADHFDEGEMHHRRLVQVDPRAAVLYRLTGDLHPVHIDPEVARAGGLRAPILHGLCTFGTSALAAAQSCGFSPLDVQTAQASFVAPVYPGDVLDVSAANDGSQARLSASVAHTRVLTGSLNVWGAAT